MLDVAEVADLLRSPTVAEDVAGTVLEVEVTAPVARRALVGLSTLPCVTVAVAPSGLPAELDLFDVVLVEGEVPGGVAAAREAIRTATARHPQAALVAAQVLRLTSRLDVPGGLVAESVAYSMLQSGPEHERWLSSRPPPHGDRAHGAPVRVQWEGDRLVVTLDRPEVRNAFGVEMRDGLVEALRLAAEVPEARVVLRGAGPAFCSGGDLQEFGTAPDPVTAHVVRVSRSAAWWASTVAARMRAEVHGACVGAGMELTAWASEVVATEDAFWFLPEVGMGLIPGAGGTVSLPRRIGRQRTALLALTGLRLDPATALSWGVADRVVAALG